MRSPGRFPELPSTLNPDAHVPDELPGQSAASQLVEIVLRHGWERGANGFRNRSLCPQLLWERIRNTHTMPVYAKEPRPYEIVLTLHRRGLVRRRVVVVAQLTLMKMKLFDGELATSVMRYLMHPPYHLTSDYLARVRVPVGEVFINLRRWFWWYGGLLVPRSLHSLICVDTAHLRNSVVKVESTEPEPPDATVVAVPTRLRR